MPRPFRAGFLIGKASPTSEDRAHRTAVGKLNKKLAVYVANYKASLARVKSSYGEYKSAVKSGEISPRHCENIAGEPARLKKSLRAIDTFLNQVSHENRPGTPYYPPKATLVGSVEVALRRLDAYSAAIMYY